METQLDREMYKAVVDDFFTPKDKAEEAEPESKPGEQSSPAITGVSSLIGAAVGSYFGPAGAEIGATAGAFVGDQAQKSLNAPSGPGATISGGSVQVSGGGGELAAQGAGYLKDLAIRGIQTKLAPSGQKKVY